VRTVRQLPRQCVLASAAADEKNFHVTGNLAWGGMEQNYGRQASKSR
jgi:hypothetical protein